MGVIQLAFDFDAIPITPEKEEFIIGNKENIKHQFPVLKIEQAEDVSFAEKRFLEGKGYLFTNGTGTGKTFVGLGIAARFDSQNKKRILIVVPTDTKAKDWVEDATNFNLEVHQLEGIKDKGETAVVTTYANFYQNESIAKVDWDLIIYDESHYLTQNEQGNETSYIVQHKEVAKLPSTVKSRLKDLPMFYDVQIDNWRGEKRTIRTLKKEAYLSAVEKEVSKTKVVLLSATPFAYHKSIKYADGLLFDINETILDQEYSGGYNTPVGFEAFLVSNFGYSMRYNKCTRPDSGIDQNLLERNFFEAFKDKGVMSTRQIQLDQDYSREFITVDSIIGEKIDEGFNLFHEQNFRERYRYLSQFVGRKFNYLFVTQLLEAVKARECHTRIQQHLDLGRKVVIFHNYNNNVVVHPFRFRVGEMLKKDEMHNASDLEKDIAKFEQEYPQFWNLNLSMLTDTRSAIKKHFPSAREFNGTISKKRRERYINEFNHGNCDVIIIQVQAGQEGISLHDTVGNAPRVLINLGLPVAPTQTIQVEGRIYRVGLKSNAIYEYPTLQTATERTAFAEKIATRAKTAENLAMGNLARDLETAFKEGYQNSSYNEPSLLQGTGGKSADRTLFTISEYDKSKTYYFQRGKRTSSNKSKEGIDYFATPEPLGFKMAEWLDPQPNEWLLEPSAGHGAIARFFPGNTNNVFVEQSHELASQCALNAIGDVQNKSFEKYYIGNKFSKIAMNPPFGVGGKTAMEHIEKACKHLDRKGGEILAIVPNGGMVQRRLDAFFDDEKNERYRLTGELILPTCTFERAGTMVNCKIIRIQDAFYSGNYKQYTHLDFSYCKDINEFFDAIEDVEF